MSRLKTKKKHYARNKTWQTIGLYNMACCMEDFSIPICGTFLQLQFQFTVSLSMHRCFNYCGIRHSGCLEKIEFDLIDQLTRQIEVPENDYALYMHSSVISEFVSKFNYCSRRAACIRSIHL